MTVINSTNYYYFDPTYGYSLDQLLAVKAPPGPGDFQAYWQRRYHCALTIDPQPIIKITNNKRQDWHVFDLSYASTDNFTINGWLLIPASGVVKRGFVVGHGYGGRVEPDYHLPFKDAALLFPCFRGLSRSARPPISADPNWHVLHNIHELDRYILGGCVEDIWLAVSAMLSLFPQTAGHLGYLGSSFAGGIGALALACESRVSKCHLHVPTFGHHLLRLKLPSHGSASSVQRYYLSHDKRKTLRVLRYYDAASAAAQITMPVHCACATFDPCVAPPGQFAIYNAVPGKKKLFILDAGHHDYADKFLQEQKLIVDLAEFFDSPDNPGV